MLELTSKFLKILINMIKDCRGKGRLYRYTFDLFYQKEGNHKYGKI